MTPSQRAHVVMRRHPERCDHDIAFGKRLDHVIDIPIDQRLQPKVQEFRVDFSGSGRKLDLMTVEQHLARELDD